jgi:microcin C transport system substrate-binding protein
MTLTRRAAIRAIGTAVAAYSLKARADTRGVAISEVVPAWRHGISLFGGLKYPVGFKHFDYVDPKAPKGGLVRRGALGTFDNFNVVVAGIRATWRQASNSFTTP